MELLVMNRVHSLTTVKLLPRFLLPVSPLAVITLFIGICLGYTLLIIIGKLQFPAFGWLQTLFQLFVDGGVWMWSILSVFFVGSGFIIERLSYFKKLKSNDVDLETISAATKKWGIDAVDRFEYTDGPLIKFFRTGRRANKNEPDIINVESSLDNSANIEMAAMEHNISWISWSIATAPLLGFLGTVWGMIEAFNAIKMANDISPAVVAGGISVALLTTAFGLVVALILQLVQNAVLDFIRMQIYEFQKGTVAILYAIKRARDRK